MGIAIPFLAEALRDAIGVDNIGEEVTISGNGS
jgi:hypothetical protein